MKIAFIGLGIMGSRMATNLLKNGLDVTVWNRTKTAAQLLEKEGARQAISAKDAAKDADIVFSMLSTPEVVEQLFLGSKGVLSIMKKGATWIDCSTVNPSFSTKAQKEAEKFKLLYIDAPVAGSKSQAEQAELVFLVGAAEEKLEAIQPYLMMMGKKVVPLGGTTKGTAFKMLVNLMLAQSMLIFSETILLGEKLGFSNDFLLQLMPNLVVTAPFTKLKVDMIRTSNYEVQFPLEWMHKDLHLATLTADELNQPLHLASLTKELFAAAKKAKMGRLDFAAIHQYLEKEEQLKANV
ncbi:NAD(P)-dependent oxidoreductase [Aureispira anguillae]|uniref:NAD(P)-dependent oxidoreductase n=2 Tax=Aureispira anguillae TaxID=2864201 RepID=A0A915YCN9_9BACT|nr:NAD(P)-dependent oxidoreductase [Aureispira anguillae]